jgi:hypothetical protein
MLHRHLARKLEESKEKQKSSSIDKFPAKILEIDFSSGKKIFNSNRGIEGPQTQQAAKSCPKAKKQCKETFAYVGIH